MPDEELPSDLIALKLETWRAARDYAVNDDPDAKALLTDRVRQLARISSSSGVYLAKLTPAGLNNQVWQGKSISQPNEVFVFIDQTSSSTSVNEAARTRLNPRPDNGFECVVIGAPSGADEWSIHSIVEYDYSEVGKNLSDILGKHLNIEKVPDPAVARDELVSSLSAGLQSQLIIEDDVDISATEVIEHLQEAKNVVLQGAPGTGKTRLALQVADALAGGDAAGYRLEALLDGELINDRKDALLAAPVVWEIIQLHPAFGYDEFVRGLRTDPDVDGFALKAVDGILPQISQVATLRKGKPTLLIIDEINRGNLSAILGETIFAIDPAHRGREVKLQCDASDAGNDTLSVPPNLYLLATMNAADRSIALLDFAVRRRFRFLLLPPSKQALVSYYAHHPNRARAAVELFEKFSNAVAEPDLQVGHSFFIVQDHLQLTDAEWAQKLTTRILHDVRPLFDEYREEGLAVMPAMLDVGSDSIDMLRHSLNVIRDNLLLWLTLSMEAL